MPPKRPSLSYKARTLFLCLIIGLFAGCEYLAPKQPLTPIYGIKGEELNPVQVVYDANDPNKVNCYKVETNGEHTGWYLSNRVMKKIFSVKVEE